MDLIDLYIGWAIFWSTYIYVGYELPTTGEITRPSTNVNLRNVQAKLCGNFLITGLILPILYRIVPSIIMFPITTLGLLSKYICLLLFIEIWFYYSHRLMHTKYLYRWHLDHHAFIKGYGLSGLYCSLFEMIFVNQMSITVPSLLLNLSLTEGIVLSFLVALNVLKGHSALHRNNHVLKWVPEQLRQSWDHDYHHRYMTHNFGVLYLLDRIHGTYYDSRF